MTSQTHFSDSDGRGVSARLCPGALGLMVLCFCLLLLLTGMGVPTVRAQSGEVTPPAFEPTLEVEDSGAVTVTAPALWEVTTNAEQGPGTETAAPGAAALAPLIPVPGLLNPQALTIDPIMGRLYVSSFSNNKVFVLDIVTLKVLNTLSLGPDAQPWGVTINPQTGKLYVAGSRSGAVYVYDAITLDKIAVIDIRSNLALTFLDSYGKWVFAVGNRSDELFVIDATTDTYRQIRLDGTGAFGLAANPNLKRVYVGFRNSGTLLTFAESTNWAQVGPAFRPCGDNAGEAPYAMDFHPARSYLYVACSSADGVNKAVLVSASDSGLSRVKWLSIGNGGPDGGGGVAVNPTTGNVFFTNSQANTVSVIGEQGDTLATIQVGFYPYGIAVDPNTGRVFTGNRVSSDLTAFNDVFVSGLSGPNGVAVDPTTHRVFVTNRLNGVLSMYDGANHTPRWLGATFLGGMPWGVAVNPNKGKVYAVEFLTGKLHILSAVGLGELAVVDVGPEATFVAVNTRTHQAFAVSHRNNKVTIVDDGTYATSTVSTGGQGAWGLAVNPRFNLVYVGHRDGGLLNVLDGNNGWQSRQQFTPCGSQGQLFAMDYNPVSSKLYVACAEGGNSVNKVVILGAATQNGSLFVLTKLAIGVGGADGGGGVAVNTSSGRALITNSQEGSVTVIGEDDKVLTPMPIMPMGGDPFGLAIDPATQRVFIGQRDSNNLAVSYDYTSVLSTAPKIAISHTIACSGRQITVEGSHFPYAPAGGLDSVTVRLLGAASVTVPLRTDGTFTAQIVPVLVNDDYVVTATMTQVPAVGAGTLLHMPRTDLPVVFVPGGGGSELIVNKPTSYWAAPDPNQGQKKAKQFTYTQGERAWLDYRGVYTALIGGDSRYYDVLELQPDGRTARPDAPPPGTLPTTPDVRVGGPVQELVLPYPTVNRRLEVVWKDVKVDIYKGLFDYLRQIGYVDDVTLFSYPYDWRKELIDTDAGLEYTIARALYASGKNKAVLITHSTGGLVIRNYLLRKGTTRVDQVISMGTPYLGLLKPAFKSLVVGDDGGVGWHATVAGIPTTAGLGIHPKEMQRLSRNWPTIYELLPSEWWFQSGTSGDGLAPYYIVVERASLQYAGPFVVGVKVESTNLDYAGSQEFLRQYNSSMVTSAEVFSGQGIGDMSRLTDRYLAQRIAGKDQNTLRRLRFAERYVCIGAAPFLACAGPYNWIELETMKQGDDTVPVRSAIGTNLRPGDDSYYCVSSAHGTLPANPAVQGLLASMLSGQLCSNKQTWAPCPGVSVETTSAAPAMPPADAPAMPPAPTYELHLFGNGTLELFDAGGNHAGPVPGYEQMLDNGIEGVMVQRAGVNTIASIERAGAYTVIVRGMEADGSAELRISEQTAGQVDHAALFSGFPLGATSVATLTLTLPSLPPKVQMQLRYDENTPVQTLTAVALSGAAAGDDVAPAVGVDINLASNQVTILAADDEGGSGIAHVYYSTAAPVEEFTEYTGPFALPLGTSCVTAVAFDNAGNTSAPGYHCLTRLPRLVR